MVIDSDLRIKEITRQELYRLWLNNHLSGLVSFPELYNRFVRNGVIKPDGGKQSPT